MHLTQRSYVLLALTAVLAIVGIWSSEPAFVGLWRIPAVLLLLGLSYEGVIIRRTVVVVDVETAPRAYLGRQHAATFTFRNASSRPVWLEYAPVLPEGFDPFAQIRKVLAPAKGSGRDAMALAPVRLGSQTWRALPLRLLGPFGLAWWPRTAQPTRPVSVVADTLAGGVGQPRGISGGIRAQRAVGAGAELHQLREYRHGDPLAWVDWKATARSRKLVTREYSEDQHLDVLIAIDAGRLSRVRAGTLDRLGVYANAAARLAQCVTPGDDRIGLLVYSDRPLAACVPARGASAVTRLRKTLETLQVEAAESDPIAAAIRVRCMLRRRGLVVLLTDLDDANVAESLTRAVRLLSPPHFVVVAAVNSPEIGALAVAEARDRRDPWVALAAQEHEARVALQQTTLRRLGASVVVAPPALLERRLFAEYEALRRSHRI